MIFDALPAIAIVTAAGLYVRGLARRPVPPWRAPAFLTGLALATVVLYGRLGELAHSRFSVHMVQHVALMYGAALLLVLGDAARVLRAGSPRFLLRAISRLPRGLRSMPRNPLLCAAGAVGAIWAWHLPVLYEAALDDPFLHWAQHVSLFVTSLLVWALAFGTRRAAEPVALAVLFAMTLAGGALGAIITFATSILYGPHSSLADQQLAGVIMWIPPGLIGLIAMVVLTARLIRPIAAVALALLVSACSYVDRDIAPYRAPAELTAEVTDGKVLYMRDCAWCHGNAATGTDRGAGLLDGTNGSALTHFMLSTGRMPIDDPSERILGRGSIYTEEQVLAIVEFLADFDQPGPDIPTIEADTASLPAGLELYQDNCAACHASTGIGAALKTSERAPDLFGITPVQIASAIRTGPGTMPVFGEGTFDERELASLVRYVDYLDEAPDAGGASLGRVGPVTEGAVGWIVGLVLLLAFARWIGTRAGEP